MAKETRSGDENDPTKNLLPWTSESKDPDQGRKKDTSLFQAGPATVLRRDSQVSESSTSNKGRSPPGSSLRLALMRQGAANSQTGSSPEADPKAPEEIQKSDMRVKSIKMTNKLGHKNLAEVYARFNKAHVEELKADLLEIGDRNSHDQCMGMRITNKAFEDMKKAQCEFCKLFFTPEQNVRELDNGLSPCSHHPGKTDALNDNIFRTNGIEFVLGKPDWNIRPPRVGIDGWTCCLRRISVNVFDNDLPKTPGCATGYHHAMNKTRCCLCDRLFTDEDNDVQPDGSSPCSYHPGKLLAHLNTSSDNVAAF